MTDLYGGTNSVESGFTLSVVSGMQVQVAAGVCWANGLRAATSVTTLTINTTSTQPRYTIIRVTVTPNHPNGTDGTTGNNLIADTNVVDFVDGTPAGSPAKPTLGNAYQVQVGSILLPASTSALTSGMLNTLDCAPNSLYDPSALTNANTHRAASLATATVHGFQATSPGGTQADSLAQTDGSGRVGHAILADSAATATSATTATTATNATQLGGVAPSGYDAAGAAATVQTNLNSHAGTSLLGSADVHGLSVRFGLTGTAVTDGSGNASFAVTFSPAFGAPPTVVPGLVNYKPGNASTCVATAITASGCTILVGFASNSGSTVQASYVAIGS